MRKKILIIVFIILVLYCFSNETNTKDNATEEDFNSQVKKCLETKNYKLLYKLSDDKLKINPKDYKAAYYKAVALKSKNNNLALDFYLDFLNQNSSTPNKYKTKWVEFAIDISKNIKPKFKNRGVRFNNYTVNLNVSKDKYCIPKILRNKYYYYYLDSDGQLFSIKISNKKATKINYYKTKDFILINDNLLFNDSVNLVKYNSSDNKFETLLTFETDDITFYSYNFNTNSCVLNYKESDVILNKYVDLNNKKMINLPKNYISKSIDDLYIVMEYPGSFEIFDIKGNYLLTIYGDFVGFSYNSNDLFYVKNYYLYYYNIERKTVEKLLFIPPYKEIKDFKVISNNKIFFRFDDYMLTFVIPTKKIFLIKAKFLHLFENGYIYENYKDKRIYFYYFKNNSINLLFKDNSVLKKIVFSDKYSSTFLIKENDKIIIKNLNPLFP